jgi:hypothetical protein
MSEREEFCKKVSKNITQSVKNKIIQKVGKNKSKKYIPMIKHVAFRICLDSNGHHLFELKRAMDQKNSDESKIVHVQNILQDHEKHLTNMKDVNYRTQILNALYSNVFKDSEDFWTCISTQIIKSYNSGNNSEKLQKRILLEIENHMRNDKEIEMYESTIKDISKIVDNKKEMKKLTEIINKNKKNKREIVKTFLRRNCQNILRGKHWKRINQLFKRIQEDAFWNIMAGETIKIMDEFKK